MAVGFSRDMWYNYIADRSHPPVASAVVEIPEYDPNHVYAWKPANNYKGWKLIDRGEAGVDDASVIQSTIDTLPNGGRIFISKGDYLLDKPLLIGGIDYLEIIGENRKTILRAKASITNIIRQVDNPVKHLTLKGIELDGNDLANAVCYFQGGVENIIFDNVYVHNSASGMVVFFDTVLGINKRITLLNSHFAYSNDGRDIVGAGGEEFTVINCIFENDENRDGEGIAIAGAKKAIIAFNRFLSRTGEGFNGNAIHTEGTCGDVIVIGNYIYQYSGHAIHIVDNVRRAVIKGNIIDATPAYTNAKPASGDIYLLGVNSGVVKGNIIEKSSWHGIVGYDVENIVIEGNVLVDASWANVGVVLGDDTNHQRSAIAILNTDQANTAKRNIVITNNIVRNVVRTYTNGILVDNQYSYVYIYDNDLRDAAGEKLYCIASNAVIKRNLGYVTENSGTATFSGDGSTTQFKIAHGLVKAPSKVLVTPMTADAAGDFYVTADDTYIYINYSTAPASGTDNVKVSWYAEV